MSPSRIAYYSIFSLSLAWSLVACTSPAEPQAVGSKADNRTPTGADAAKAAPDTQPTLLLSQAQFAYKSLPNGKKIPQPGAAKLTMLTFNGKTFDSSVLEDEESRVFHKAVCINEPGQPRKILTLAATGAHLKTWTYADGKWTGQSHWKPEFGGKWDRLRDVEIGDVNQDGKDELVLATHDQGVIAVASPTATSWDIKEIFKQKTTFIHEIEIGDVDGDEKLEFFATPSQPNRANQSQGGSVIGFFHEKDTYRKETVVDFPKRHAKEIFVGDIDGDGVDELYASVEAQTRKSVSGPSVVKPLEIRRYDRQKNGKWAESTVATLSGGIQARVILGADFMNTGKKQLVVTTMKAGIFVLEYGPKKWTKHLVDANSSGFEHAAGLFDMDADGVPELYVTADDQDVVKRYRHTPNGFRGEVISQLKPRDLTWSIEFCP